MPMHYGAVGGLDDAYWRPRLAAGHCDAGIGHRGAVENILGRDQTSPEGKPRKRMTA